MTLTITPNDLYVELAETILGHPSNSLCHQVTDTAIRLTLLFIHTPKSPSASARSTGEIIEFAAKKKKKCQTTLGLCWLSVYNVYPAISQRRAGVYAIWFADHCA